MGNDLSVFVCTNRPRIHPLTFHMSWSAYSFREIHII